MDGATLFHLNLMAALEVGARVPTVQEQTLKLTDMKSLSHSTQAGLSSGFLP